MWMADGRPIFFLWQFWTFKHIITNGFPFQKLYTYPNNFRAFKALVAAQYSGAKVEVPKDFVFGETNKSDAFLKKFPLGKVRYSC